MGRQQQILVNMLTVWTELKQNHVHMFASLVITNLYNITQNIGTFFFTKLHIVFCYFFIPLFHISTAPYHKLGVPTTGPIYYQPTPTYGNALTFPFYGTPYHNSLESYNSAPSNVPILGPVYQKARHQISPLSHEKKIGRLKSKRDSHDEELETSSSHYHSNFVKNQPSYNQYSAPPITYSSNYAAPPLTYSSNYPTSYPSNYILHVVQIFMIQSISQMYVKYTPCW